MIRWWRLSPKQKYSSEVGERCGFYTTYISSLRDLIPAQSRYGSLTRPFPREWILPQKVKGLIEVTGRGLQITSHCIYARKIIPMCTMLHESLSDYFYGALSVSGYRASKDRITHAVIVFSETAFCLLLQEEPTQLDPTDRASPISGNQHRIRYESKHNINHPRELRQTLKTLKELHTHMGPGTYVHALFHGYCC
jgi:hypothetical protein